MHTITNKYFCTECNKVHDTQKAGLVFKTGFRWITEGQKVPVGQCISCTSPVNT